MPQGVQLGDIDFHERVIDTAILSEFDGIGLDALFTGFGGRAEIGVWVHLAREARANAEIAER